MEQKTLKDLKWFLIKDLELYNKPLPKNKRSLWDLVAFDVETDEGIFTILKTSEALKFYPNDKDKKAYSFIVRSIENFEDLPVPINLNMEMLFKNDPNRYSVHWAFYSGKLVSIKSLMLEIKNNEF